MIKRLLGFGLILLSGPAMAGPGLFGTKASPSTGLSAGAAAPVGALPIFQMLLALAVVLALVKWVLPTLFKKYSPKFGAKSSGGIHIEETAAFGPTTLAVVTVKGRTLLIGSSPQSVNCLADLTEGAKAQAAVPTFAEIFETEKAYESKPANPMGDLANQLERLKSLGL